MKLGEVANVIGGKVVCGNGFTDKDVVSAFASDLMSDVLTLDTEGLLLITGLANMQTIRTAEMADIAGIVFVRNKKPSAEMVNLADELGIVLIESASSMFNVSGKLFQAGIKPLF
ncbi:MAG: hypothetical protein HC906_05115 [Bacteroidales bacterium]|nr:hypothetical protein [Bacteroidales bacterium]